MLLWRRLESLLEPNVDVPTEFGGNDVADYLSSKTRRISASSISVSPIFFHLFTYFTELP